MKWDFIKDLSHLVAIDNNNGELLTQALALNPKQVTAYTITAENVKQLTQQFANKNNVKVVQAVLNASNQAAVFYHYNLPQLSALLPANDNLASLFPGLKLQQTTELETQDFSQELSKLNLADQQNMLLLTQPAQNLVLLKHLAANQQLNMFSAIVVQHSADVLYKGSANLAEVVDFLTNQDYQLIQTDNTDTDFPVLQFYRDATLQELKNAKLKLSKLNEQLADVQQQLALEKQQAEQTKAELTKQLESSKQQLALVTAQLGKLQKELEQAQKHAANRLDKVDELEKANQLLNDTNTQLHKRQVALEQEMLKAEAQIDIIKELLLKPE